MRKRQSTIQWILGAVCIHAVTVGSSPAVRAANGFNYDDYVAVLKKYVDDKGMVAYRALKADPKRLDAFASAMATLDRRAYDKWDDKAKIAFWLNAYNALTLKVILDNYPIRASFVGSLRFPKNSIRQIPGVWDKVRFRVMGRRVTLSEIEHTTLRKAFDEPRIHLALVCASKGCPLLRREPYEGADLDAQLDDQTRRFLATPGKFRIARSKGQVYLSPIFKWFGEDFVKTYGTNEKFRGHGKELRAVLNFTSRYLNERDREYLATGHYKVLFLDYDWSLNEQLGAAKR
jgi:hypothetical protein